MHSKGFVILTLSFQHDGKRWLGRCLELTTSTYGRSLLQTHRELVELVDLHVDALEQAGELGRFFGEHGIKFYTDNVMPEHLPSPSPSVVESGLYLHYHRIPLPAGT